MKVLIDNSEYERSHGKAPKGYGLWFFDVLFSDGAGSFTDGLRRSATGTLAHARLACSLLARNEAKGIGRVNEITMVTLP